MIELLLVSLLWAFSFGLVKGELVALDPSWVAFCRLVIAAAIFAPLVRWRELPRRLVVELALLGGVQFGLMYATYIAAFQVLKSFEVALLTIFTPLFVVAVEAMLARSLRWLFLVAAGLATLGTGLAMRESLVQASPAWTGILLMQLSNLCFALGQVWYRRLLAREHGIVDRQVFGVLYVGAALTAALLTLVLGDVEKVAMTGRQFGVLVYLGAVASGLGFFLWNRGARRVDVGTLAVFNDLKIPLATLVSLLVFGEQANLQDLALGGGLVILALLAIRALQRRRSAPPDAPPPTE
ncbi:MAG: EamA family transporter [Pseudomonadota bacterium]